MSFNDFFPDDATQQQQLNYQSYQPRPARTESTSTYQQDLAFFPSSSSQQYYALQSALHAPESFPDSPQHAYIPTPKLEHAQLYNQPQNFSRYQSPPASSYAPYPYAAQHTPALLAYDTYHPAQDLLLLPDPAPPPPPATDEPRTPASPQFIFEFPGGEPDPDDPDPAPPDPDPAPSPSACARAHSPATEEMKSMMSVFRVDPFASYDTAAADRRHRRRKRASAYARAADPAAASRETPLVFAFQLAVPAPPWADDPPAPASPLPDFSRAAPSHRPPDAASSSSSSSLCPPSESSYDYDCDYDYDLRSESPPPVPARAPSPRAGPKTHACWLCRKAFPRPSGLATHMHSHSGAKPYRCPVPACAKPFAVRSNARRHLRTHSAAALASAYEMRGREGGAGVGMGDAMGDALGVGVGLGIGDALPVGAVGVPVGA